MSGREQYAPGAASGAEVRKDGEKWTLVLVRDLPHNPESVWKALTDPEHLREWAPFDSDRNLGTVGTAKLSTVGAPTPHVSETQVKRADAPKVLEFSWGGQDIRWELEPRGGGGTRPTLWHNIDRGFISMGPPLPRRCRNHQNATAGSTVRPATTHQIRRFEPVTSSTAAVHVGARSSAGTASAASAGRSAQ